MKVIIINGPNLNLLGKREPELYGHQGFEQYLELLRHEFEGHEIDYFQSNHEGELIDKIQETGFSAEGLIINAGGYSHTSIAIADAISAVTAPAIEVHITNIYAREAFRHKSILSPCCRGVIAGLGLEGYRAAIRYFVDNKLQK